MLIKKCVKYKNWSLPSLGGVGWTEEYAAECLEFTQEEIELYELWFEFMKRSKYSRWSSEVKRDFLNVSLHSKTAHRKMEFPEWWTEHNYSFAVAAVPTVLEVTNSDDYQYFEEMANDPDVCVKIFAVFMDSPISEVKRQITDFMKSYKQRSKAEAIRRSFDGPYPLHGAYKSRYLPDATMLWKILEVYDLKNYYESNGIRRFGWQIEEELTERRLNSCEQGFINRDPRFKVELSPNTPGGVTTNKYTWEDLGKERRKVQASTISRYYRQAQMIIANVEKGVFPKLS